MIIIVITIHLIINSFFSINNHYLYEVLMIHQNLYVNMVFMLFQIIIINFMVMYYLIQKSNIFL